jgi:1-acyl-sn-glycerol-3-phosphate acyltransferase
MRALTFFRSALYLVVLAVTVAPWSFVVCASIVTPVPVRYWLARCWTRFAIFAARAICGIRYHVEGWHNLPDEPAIVLCKHQSAWETLWLPSAMPRELTFVYKKELNWVPFFGWGIASLQMISINRGQGADAFEQVVAQGTDRLARGWWIVIFPEGTRTPPGSLKRYKTGGARLAVRTGAKIVPIAHNTGEVWPRRSFLKRPGAVTISILPAIDPRGKNTDEVAAAVESAIESEMRRLAPHRYSAPNVPTSPTTAATMASP